MDEEVNFRSDLSGDWVRVEVLNAIRKALVEREQDLRWCTKDDDCHIQAKGVALAISDFDYVLNSDPRESSGQ